MGFFGGKKAKDKVKETEREAPDPASRKSRRIVPASKAAPAGTPAPAAAPGKGADSRGAAVVRSGPVRPAAKAGTDSGRVQEQRDQARPPQAAPQLDGEIKPPVRPKSREPISLGQSEPPKFAGALNIGSARKGGPCRTGDDALMDFLQNKASLIDGGQADSVRGKAEQESLPIDVAAVQLGFITEEQMVNALTSECWVPHLKVDKYEIRKKALDTISREDAVHYGVFPVDKLGSLLTLAMVNPLDAETIRVLEAKTSLDIKKVVATRSEITQGIEKYYSGSVQVVHGGLRVLAGPSGSGHLEQPVLGRAIVEIAGPEDGFHRAAGQGFLAGHRNQGLLVLACRQGIEIAAQPSVVSLPPILDEGEALRAENIGVRPQPIQGGGGIG